MTRRAVVLARGLGSRLRAADPAARLDPAQLRAADAGQKAMFPVAGRPLLDYVLSGLADAGLTDVALVVAPDHAAIRARYDEDAPPTRVQLSYVVQPQAKGTADAVLAVERWTDDGPFVVVNADNVYPPRALADLAALDEPGLPVFAADDLLRTSNIPPDRLAAFALVEFDRAGYLSRIVEKPPAPPALVSMNCWRFDSRIFPACRDVSISPRGEYELPVAVGLAIERGVRFRGVPASGPVLDLSRRTDAEDLAQRLARSVPRP